MTTKSLATALILALLATVGISSAEAQVPSLVSTASIETATDVVNGRVVVVQSIDAGAEVHSLVLLAIDEALKGDLSGDVFVEVPGGTTSAGLDVIVSHQPQLRVGDHVQLALVRATPAEEALLTGGLPVYSIVGGTAGTAAVSGSTVSQAEAVGDFTLTGTAWAGFPVDYRINPANSGLDAASTIGALEGGFDGWVDDPGSDIVFNYVGTTSASPSNHTDGINTVGWVDTPSSADGYLAQAIWVSSGGSTVGFDIRFNRDYLWTWGAEPGRFDIETVNLHEVGHVLGLGHTSASTAEVMYPSVSSNTVKGLGEGDRSGVAHLYPAANPGGGGGATTCGDLAVTIDMNSNGGDGTGTEGDDVILGTPGADTIEGLGGDDVICGGDGDDRIFGGDGADTVFGGDGDDLVLGGAGSDHLNGEAGADRLVGNEDDDKIFGADGNDLLWGEDGSDQLFGGLGNDYLIGKAGDDLLDAGPGTDFLNGGEGNDEMIGGPGLDRLWGFGGADWLRGGDGDDRLFGMDGNDTLAGQDGNDIMNAGAGDDTASGGEGNDLMWGLDGADTLNGDAGNDTINGGGFGPNTIHGGDGDDSVLGGSGTDRVWGGTGLDRVWGGEGNDVLYGESGNDRLFGMGGNDGCHGAGGTDVAVGCETVTHVP